MKLTNKRILRSKRTYIALTALLLFIFKNYGLFKFIGLNPEAFNELSNLILGLLVTIGIINNPK